MTTPPVIDGMPIKAWPATLSGSQAAWTTGLPAIGPRLTFGRDEEIFGEGEPADYIYQVLKGVARTCRFTGGGRRQIEDFHAAGEYFGLEPGDEHTCSAEAVGPVTLLLLRRGTLNDLAARDVAVAGRLMRLTMDSLRRSRTHIAMLGRKGACERLAAFLIDAAERYGTDACTHLPISRQEIADYLGLTIETISRSFSQLEAQGVIALRDRRSVLVRDPQRLRELCD